MLTVADNRIFTVYFFVLDFGGSRGGEGRAVLAFGSDDVCAGLNFPFLLT